MADAGQCAQKQPKHEGSMPKVKRRSSGYKNGRNPHLPAEPSHAASAIAGSARGHQNHHAVQGSSHAAAQPAGQAPAGSPQQVLPQPAPVAQAAAIHPPPQQEDPFVTAIRLLMQQGLPEAKARAALQRVPAAGRTLEGWVIAAIEWQTAQDDLEAEKRDLELAMQASLREEEERKSQQTPLEQQTPEQLLQHFKGSILLAALRKSPMADQLFLAPLLLPVLRLLKLEQQSCRWYASSGTRKYFEALAEECAVSEHSMHSSTEPAPTETPPSNSKRAPKRRRKSPCNKGADADAAAAEGASPSPEAAASVFQQFADFIDSKAAALEVGLYQMPGTSGEVPAIFLDDAPDAEADVGEVQEHVFSEPEHCLSDEEAIVLD